MVSPISFDSFTSWFNSGESLNSDSLTLAQFNPHAAPAAPTAQAPQQQPLIPQIAIDPANPNQLQAQPGVVNIDLHPRIEHGTRTDTHAIVLHMTNATASQTLLGYQTRSLGAHFLVARDGTITQTAGLDQEAWHVGVPRPKGYQPIANSNNNLRVDADLTAASQRILDRMDAHKIPFSEGIKQLGALEYAKPYGSDRTDETTRGPLNSDSIGIEFEAVAVNGVYPALTDAQRASGLALLNVLEARYGLTSADVYEHPDVSYKTYSEARGAKQQIEYYTGD
jgi:N-acetylmuramoyl-L-alanine amidase